MSSDRSVPYLKLMTQSRMTNKERCYFPPSLTFAPFFPQVNSTGHPILHTRLTAAAGPITGWM